jgi:hypothetical protein
VIGTIDAVLTTLKTPGKGRPMIKRVLPEEKGKPVVPSRAVEVK